MSEQLASQAQVAEDDMADSFGPLLINKLEVRARIAKLLIQLLNAFALL